ncbi:growth factor receptor-bound protein 7 isoform X3 [Fukomys damarensis]|uniref:growth factor receptor-bound protein 7 isoform X3 n=1 Tax=Fukomys damarensis TaxID=885580 RepID=UPI0005400502|nr:growth factor receptor-bound protein 7 isoform X3 [Fukomys damarensis]
MEPDLSPPCSGSPPEDLCPTPGTPPGTPPPGTPPPPEAPVPGEVVQSQPLPIPASRKLPEEKRQATSLPSIPNPFPELCSPPSHSPILGGPSSARGLLPRDTSRPHVVKVYSEDGACRSVEVAAGATARHVCEMLVQRTQALSDESWGLVECHPHLALERGLEDHESVVDVQAVWPVGGDSRFVFRKNFAKYELFKSSPHSLFPEKMVSSCLDAHTGVSHEDLIQDFLNADSFPEIQGFLQLRGSGRKLWKRCFCFLRRSGLYFSTKGTSKDPRHLQYVADVNESNVYVVTQGRKLYGLPTDFGFCVKAWTCPVPLPPAQQAPERPQGAPGLLQRGRAEPHLLAGRLPPLQVWGAAVQELPAGPVSPPAPILLGVPALEERLRQHPGGHGLLGPRRPRHREPPGGPERCPGGGPGLEEKDKPPPQPAHPELGHQPQHSHPPHPALVPRTNFPGREPEAHRAAGPGGRPVPGPGESAEPTRLCPVLVPPAEGQALPHPSK